MIKKGYQLHITTWENDADHYKTKVISGLDVYDCKFIIELCSLFTSASSSKGFGNRGATENGDRHNSCIDDIKSSVEVVLQKHGDFISDLLKEDIEGALNFVDGGIGNFHA